MARSTRWRCRASRSAPTCAASLGWLPDAVYRDAPVATEAELTRFHDPAYVAALRQAEADQAVGDAVRARFRIGAEGNPVYRDVYPPSGNLRRWRDAGGAPGRFRRHRPLPRGWHTPWTAGPCVWLLLPQRPRSRIADMAGARPGQHRLSGHRRASWRWRAGRLPRRSASIDHQLARECPLAVHRCGGRPGGRDCAQLPAAGRLQRQRVCLGDAAGGRAADRRPPAAGDHAAGGSGRAGGRSAGEIIAVQ